MTSKMVLLAITVSLASFGQSQSAMPSTLDLARVSEVTRLVESQGNAVWPGWKSVPLLLRKADADYLIGHPNPPAGFNRVLDDQGLGRSIYRRAGHLIPVPAATTWPVAGLWCLALPTLEEFQRAVDQALGAGVIKLDEASYVAAAVHEAFHANQMNTTAQGPALFGFQGDEGKLLNTLTNQPNHSQQLAVEGRVLRDALGASDLTAVWQAVERFLEARRSRRAALPSEVAAYEQALEWREGLARYAEVSLMRKVAGQASGDGRFVYPSNGWQTFLGQLGDVSQIPGTLRDRYYVLGAAQGFVLDRLMGWWKPQAIPGGTSLEQLLRDLSQRASGAPAALQNFRLTKLHLATEHLWVALADQPQLWQQGLAGVKALGGLDGLLFRFPEEGLGKFTMKGALMPLEIAFFDQDGLLLERLSMGLCDRDPCPRYGPEKAFQYALETPVGRLPHLPVGSRLDLP